VAYGVRGTPPVANGLRRRLFAGGRWIRTIGSALDRQQVSWVRPSCGRSTGAPLIRAVAGLRIPIEVSGGGPRAATHHPDRDVVTPWPRCRRSERIAEPRVRIRSPPAGSPLRTGCYNGLELGLSHGTRQAGEFERKPSSLSLGTDGSNPATSSGESVTNSIRETAVQPPVPTISISRFPHLEVLKGAGRGIKRLLPRR
jgi:hypothetical protein